MTKKEEKKSELELLKQKNEELKSEIKMIERSHDYWYWKAQELENEIEDLRYNAKWNAIRDIVLWILILIWCIINQTF